MHLLDKIITVNRRSLHVYGTLFFKCKNNFIEQEAQFLSLDICYFSCNKHLFCEMLWAACCHTVVKYTQ